MLEVKHARLQIEQKLILQDVNFQIEAGSILGVLGANGAGKTSLLKLISGQLPSDEMIFWQGRSIEKLSQNERAKQIAVVNQFNQSVFALNLEQIVGMGLLPHQSLFSGVSDQQKRQIESAMNKVGLSSHASQAFNTLSGGEQQRGLIARALVQRAQLIVLDEPINHLDIYYQHQILHLLRELASTQGLCVVMSLHDINLAANYCDQLCLLNAGQLLAHGTPKQVLTESRLQNAFNMPCKVTEDGQGEHCRVEFFAQHDQVTLPNRSTPL